MKRTMKISLWHHFIVLLFFFSTIATIHAQLEKQHPNSLVARPFLIRVLLNSTSNIQLSCSSFSYTLHSNHGFLVSIPTSPSLLRIKEQNIEVTVNPNKFIIQTTEGKIKQLAASEILCAPRHTSNIKLNETSYRGGISFVIHNKCHYVINTLPLHDYLTSILRFETYQSWPLEMHKVQAIVSRTYALHHIMNARRQQKPYDIKCSNFHQTYKGLHTFDHLKQAVSETKNMVITHKEIPISAMFDICCGGIIPAHMKAPQFDYAPYLNRNHPCTFCKNYTLHTWKQVIPYTSLIEKLNADKQLKPLLNTIGRLQNITIKEKDKAGIVHKLNLIGTKKTTWCSGKRFSKNIKGVRSLSFSLQPSSSHNTIIIKGNGYGHLLGLCQRGAYELVKQSWKVSDIIHFYYPNTHISSLNSQTFEEQAHAKL